MDEVKRIRAACRKCHGGCGAIAPVKDGKVMTVEEDPVSPVSHGTTFSKGLAITQLACRPERVLYPMKKTGKGWERISWDEPLDTICQGYKQVIQEHGPDSIVIGQGTGRDYDSFLWYRSDYIAGGTESWTKSLL